MTVQPEQLAALGRVVMPLEHLAGLVPLLLRRERLRVAALPVPRRGGGARRRGCRGGRGGCL